MIRFNFASGYGPDCFIDNVAIKEAPQNDVGVVIANLPTASTGCEVDSSLVTATIFNFGYLPQSGFNVQYSLNGNPFVETVFDTLQPGDSLLYTFSLPVDLTQDGTYSLILLPTLLMMTTQVTTHTIYPYFSKLLHPYCSNCKMTLFV